MIINGTNVNTFFSPATGVQRKAAMTTAAKSPFTRRFDTLELSDFFKKFSNADENKSQTSEIQKMLAKTENVNAKTMADGITGYAYMELSLGAEAMRTAANIFKFNYYSEEKSYYQSLLNEADGNAAASVSRQMPAHDGYEYVCNENEPVDREKALQALTNVQSLIDNLINETKNGSNKVDMQTYNKCAASFASAFGIDYSSVALSENDYNKLFGKMEVTEENYIQMCCEKKESLRKCYDNLEECLSKSINRIRSEPNGEERVKAINTAFSKAYGNSLADIIELQLTAEETE